MCPSVHCPFDSEKVNQAYLGISSLLICEPNKKTELSREGHEKHKQLQVMSEAGLTIQSFWGYLKNIKRVRWE